MPDLLSKFLGGMVGGALGDAIGELAFMHPDRARLEAEVEAADTLVYTDDTAMALGLAESLAARGRVDTDHLGEVFAHNFEREPWRGYAQGPPAIFARMRREGVRCTEAARALFGGEGSFGNGAAMHIAPLGLFRHRAADLYGEAARSAETTHAHPIGRDGAAVLALAVARAAMLDPAEPFPAKRLAEELAGFARTPEMGRKMRMVRELLARSAPVNEAAGKLGRGIEAHRSVPHAIYAFLRHPGSFEECLMAAVLSGGDRDTLGAMACGASGAYLGIEAIPEKWYGRLENREHIEALARRLYETILQG